MTTYASTAQNPTSFGFEAGVRPPEITVDFNGVSSVSVIDVPTLHAPYNTGPTSTRALQLVPGNQTTHYIDFRFHVVPGSTISFKVATSVGPTDSFGIYGPAGVISRIGGESAWQTITLSSTTTADWLFEVDFAQDLNASNHGGAAAGWITDFAATGGAYLMVSPTNGEAYEAPAPAAPQLVYNWDAGYPADFKKSENSNFFNGSAASNYDSTFGPEPAGDATIGYILGNGNINVERYFDVVATWAADGTLVFDAAISANPTTGDAGRVFIDGVNVYEIVATSSGAIPWQAVSLPVAAGTHTIRFSYIKGNNYYSYQDLFALGTITMNGATAGASTGGGTGGGSTGGGGTGGGGTGGGTGGGGTTTPDPTSTAANPPSFGFESGVVPPELNISGTSSVVAVSTLPAPNNTGTTSPRALQVVNGQYAVIPIHGNGVCTYSLKIAAPAGQTYTVYSTTNGYRAIGTGTGGSGWQTISETISSGAGFETTLEIDGANFWVTDITVDNGGYVKVAAITAAGNTGGGDTGGGGSTTPPKAHQSSGFELSVVSTGDAVVDSLLSWNLNTDGVGEILIDGVAVETVTGGQTTNNQYTHHTTPVPEGVHVVRWQVTSGDLGGQNVATIDQMHISGTTPDGYVAGWNSAQPVVEATGTLTLKARLHGHVRNSEDPIPDISVSGTSSYLAGFQGYGEIYVPPVEVVVSGTSRLSIDIYSGFFVELDVLDTTPDSEDDPNSPDVIPDV